MNKRQRKKVWTKAMRGLERHRSRTGREMRDYQAKFEAMREWWYRSIIRPLDVQFLDKVKP